MTEYHFELEEVIPNLSNDEYHSVGKKILSSSYLKNVYFHSANKADMPTRTTIPMMFGTAFHDMMELGEKEYLKEHPIIPDDCSDKRTKKYKDFILKYPGGITMKDFQALNTMYYNTKNNEWFKEHLDKYDVRHEWSYYGYDINGLRYRVRPDIQFGNFTKDSIHTPSDVVSIFDYKTTEDVTKFVYTIKQYGYDLSAIMYCAMLNVDPVNWYWLAVEKTEPFTVQVFGMSQETIQRGRKRLSRAIEKVALGERGIGYELIERV